MYGLKKLFNSIDDLKIIKAVVTLLIFVLLAKVAGLCKEVLIARQFGVSPEIDAYNFIFTFVQWPVSIFGSVIGAVLIPMVSNMRSHGFGSEIKLFRSEVLGVTIALSFMVMFVFYGLFDQLLVANIFGLEETQVSYVEFFLPYLVWAIPLGFITMLLSAWTMSSQRHINTILEAIPALTISGLLFLLGSAVSIVLGVVVGFFLQASLLAYFLYKHKEIEWPRFKVTSVSWSPLVSYLSYMLVGQVLTSVIYLVDQYFAAGLGVGAISILSYAEKILAIILSLGVVVVGRAILPVFSDAHNQGRFLKRVSMKWAGIMFLVGVVAAVVFFNYAEAIVRIIFERGAFNEQDTEEVSRLLRVASWQIPFYIGGMVLTYSLISAKKFHLMAWIGFYSLLIKLLSIGFLVNLFGTVGIVLSTVLVYFASSMICFYFLIRIK